jgi:putative ABC transport system permease protein
MSLLDSFRTAFGSLWSNGLRSFLALLGIIIGVFAVTSMVSLGKMLTAGINKSLDSVASRSVIVQPDYQNGMNLKPVKPADLEALSRLPVTMNPQWQLSVQYERPDAKRYAAQIIGTDGDLPKIDPGIKLARNKGTYFTAQQAKAGMAVCVVNPSAVREMLRNTNDPVGKTIRVYYPDGTRAELTVIGVIEPLPAMFGGDMPMLYAPTPYLWRMHPDARRDEYGYVLMRVREGFDEKEVEKQAKRIMESRYGKGVFMVQSIASAQEMLGNITKYLQIGLGFIAGLSLLVGGIGIMNIMLVSVTERTREIGLRKALGATSKQIRTQFLVESSMLTMLGGAIGVALAAGFLGLITVFVPLFSTFILSPSTVAMALGVSIGTGLIFGVGPAIRASKLDPIESLRYE